MEMEYFSSDSGMRVGEKRKIRTSEELKSLCKNTDIVNEIEGNRRSRLRFMLGMVYIWREGVQGRILMRMEAER